MTQSTWKMVRKKDLYLHWVLYEHVIVEDSTNILLIPLEMSREQIDLIDKTYDVDDDMDDYELDDFYDEVLPEILNKTIADCVQKGMKYFSKHKDKWIHTLEPIHVTDYEIAQFFMLKRLKGEPLVWSGD